MSEVTAVLRKHREELNEEDVCICGHHGDWPAHVAERLESELQPEHDRQLAQAWNAGFKEGMKVRI